MISAFRFFTVVRLHSRYMLVAMAAVLASGVVMLVIDAGTGADAIGPLALLQMLAASTGFAVSARRGHLDLLLTAGPRRATVAFVHLGASVLPGATVWILLGLAEMLTAATARPQAFASGTVAAMMGISVVSWALTVRLPRLSGGIAWLLGIAVWVIGWSGQRTLLAAGDAAMNPSTRAVVATLCPFVLIGKRIGGPEWVATLPILLVAVVLGAEAVAWIVRTDVALESAQ